MKIQVHGFWKARGRGGEQAAQRIAACHVQCARDGSEKTVLPRDLSTGANISLFSRFRQRAHGHNVSDWARHEYPTPATSRIIAAQDGAHSSISCTRRRACHSPRKFWMADVPRRLRWCRNGRSPTRSIPSQSKICCMQPAGAIPRLRRHLDGELIVVRPGIEAGLRPCAHVSSRSWLFANSRPGAGSPWTLLAACMVLSAENMPAWRITSPGRASATSPSRATASAGTRKASSSDALSTRPSHLKNVWAPISPKEPGAHCFLPGTVTWVTYRFPRVLFGAAAGPGLGFARLPGGCFKGRRDLLFPAGAISLERALTESSARRTTCTARACC